MIEIIDLEKQEKQKLENNGTTLLSQAKELVIIDDTGIFILKSKEEKEKAGQLLKDAFSLERKIKEHYSPMKKKADELKKGILDAERESLCIPSEVKRILSGAIGEFEHKERIEAERKLREEKERIEKERREEALKKEKEAEKALAEGKTAEANKLFKEVEQTIEEPIEVKPVEISEKISGTRTTMYWKYETIDAEAIKEKILSLFTQGKEFDLKEVSFFLSFLQNNDVAINLYVKTQKALSINKLPGIKVYSKPKTSPTGR